jgi:hypothetical protein
METKVEELTGKLKALDLVLAKSKDTVTARNKDALINEVNSRSREKSAHFTC